MQNFEEAKISMVMQVKTLVFVQTSEMIGLLTIKKCNAQTTQFLCDVCLLAEM
jgi:hypothetical protein